MIRDTEQLFGVFDDLHFIFWKLSIQFIGPFVGYFVSLVFNVCSYLYILDINSFSDV